MVTSILSRQSVSHWIANLRYGDEEAVQSLWTRYATQLVAVARNRLGHAKKSVADEEDVVQLVFASLCRGISTGKFKEVRNRDELWWLLLAMTKRKAVDHIRRETAQKRGGISVDSDERLIHERFVKFEFSDVISDEPTPVYLASLLDQYAHLMKRLTDERLRHVVVARIEGYTVAEVAEQLNITKRSVERKLQLIRNKWALELDQNV